MPGFNPFRYRFPYTNLNDINLDWIIKKVKQNAAALQSKQDKPDTTGVAGQVLGLDENLVPVWLDQSGGGGSANYDNLINKPQINGVTLLGNKTAADLGLANASDIPTVPVQSVNGQTGAVELDAGDVGALPSNTFIPGYSLQLPVMDGEASAGTNFSRYAMEGHRHPTDTSRASTAALATYIRPNLLVNGYFVGGGSQLGYGKFPINQRGQGTYLLSSNAYGVDRWASFQVGSKHTLNSDGVLIETNGSNYAQIAQRVVNFPQGAVTISFLTGSVVPTNSVRIYLLFSDGTNDYYDCSDLGQNDLGYHTFIVSKTVTEIRFYTNAAGSKFSLQAAKAELGDTQTLAHKEGSTWVLNAVPDYAEQLAKCQAYLLPISALSRTRTNIVLPDALGFDVPVPVTMAKNPTIIGTLRVSTLTGSFVSGFTFDVDGISSNAVRLRASKTSHGLSDGFIDSDAVWYLSAE